MRMFKYIKEDIAAAKKYDPAAPNSFMLFIAYPGLIALRRHRFAHKLYEKGFKNLARWLSYRTRKMTGIDIHPGAQIGRRVFIDHGMGIVIGETTVIGNDVIIYHGVTLGASTFSKVDRHPKIGNNVILYANATVAGNISIGDNSIVATGSVVLKSMPENSFIKGMPATSTPRKEKNSHE